MMKTLELMVLSELHNRGYDLNTEMTTITDVMEYIESANEGATPSTVYTPEDWVIDTASNYPEYLVRR